MRRHVVTWVLLAAAMAGCLDGPSPAPIDGRADDPGPRGDGKASTAAPSSADASSGGPPAADNGAAPNGFEVAWERNSTALVVVASSQQVEHGFTSSGSFKLALWGEWAAPSATIQFLVSGPDGALLHDTLDAEAPGRADYDVSVGPGRHAVKMSLFGVDALHDFRMGGTFT